MKKNIHLSIIALLIYFSAGSQNSYLDFDMNGYKKLPELQNFSMFDSIYIKDFNGRYEDFYKLNYNESGKISQIYNTRKHSNTQVFSYKFDYSYNKSNQLSNINYININGNITDYSVIYGYNTSNQCNMIDYSLEKDSYNRYYNKNITFEYDKSNNIIKEIVFDSTSTDPSKYSITYQRYYDNDRLTQTEIFDRWGFESKQFTYYNANKNDNEKIKVKLTKNISKINIYVNTGIDSVSYSNDYISSTIIDIEYRRYDSIINLTFDFNIEYETIKPTVDYVFSKGINWDFFDDIYTNTSKTDRLIKLLKKGIFTNYENITYGFTYLPEYDKEGRIIKQTKLAIKNSNTFDTVEVRKYYYKHPAAYNVVYNNNDIVVMFNEPLKIPQDILSILSIKKVSKSSKANISDIKIVNAYIDANNNHKIVIELNRPVEQGDEIIISATSDIKTNNNQTVKLELVAKGYSPVNIINQDSNNNVIVYYENNSPLVESKYEIQSIKVYELNGRLIYSNNNITSKLFNFSEANLSKGYYITEVTNNNGTKFSSSILILQ